MVPSGMPGPKDEERKQAAESMRDAERIQPKNYQVADTRVLGTACCCWLQAWFATVR
jgi:hypothetical protein